MSGKKAERERALVLDTSAFIMGINPSVWDIPTYTTPLVYEELRKEALATQRVSASKEGGRLTILPPSRSSIQMVQEASQSLGEQATLSTTDQSILALALDLESASKEPLIISDDFAIQNVAEYLHIKYASLATRGIQRLLGWTFYCPACFRKYSIARPSVCRVCGTPLKRRSGRGSLVRFKE